MIEMLLFGLHGERLFPFINRFKKEAWARPLPWGALQGAEAGRQAQYLLEVALPVEIQRVAEEEGGSREKGEGAEKRINSLGKEGVEEKEKGERRREGERREKEGTNRSHPLSFLRSSS